MIVARGELQNLVGTVTMINAQEGLLHVQPAHQELTDVLPIDAMLLEKYFTVGKVRAFCTLSLSPNAFSP